MFASTEAHHLCKRTGQQRRQDDWLVGKRLRDQDPGAYAALLHEARKAAVQAAAKAVGLTTE